MHGLHGGRADSTDKNEATCGRAIRVSGNQAQPERSYTLLNREKMEYVQFRNPGDSPCGRSNVRIGAAAMPNRYKVQHSLMNHGAFCGAAALL